MELADMLHYIVALAALNELDLNAIMLEKDKMASRKYHHNINLETFLSEGGLSSQVQHFVESNFVGRFPAKTFSGAEV